MQPVSPPPNTNSPSMSSQPPVQLRDPRVFPLSSLFTIQEWGVLALHRLSPGGGESTSATVHPPASFSTSLWSSIPINFSSRGSLTTKNHEHRWTGKKSQMISMDMLPDDVLLAIFDFCANGYRYGKKEIEGWQSLVHVCRRWRSLVFGSPNRLDLRLVCTPETPARNMLDIWPALPLLIQGSPYLEEGIDNIIAVLERSDRVREIDFSRSNSHLETLSAAMLKPFPELTHLMLSFDGEGVLPDSFLGGSVPRLQFAFLYSLPFPGIPKLLLSATNLVKLNLMDIPHSGYFSPEAMATGLSTLTRLEQLMLKFQSPRSRPDRATRRLPPPTRSVLSGLTIFQFKGDNEYLDDLVAHIDAPQLSELRVDFFNDIVFYTPQFFQFIRRTPRLGAHQSARVVFSSTTASVFLSSPKVLDELEFHVTVAISSREFDWQVLSLEQVCTSSLPPLSSLEQLHIFDNRPLNPHLQENSMVENAVWLELLQSFRAVKNLYLSKESARSIVSALQELVGGRVTEVLPTLQNIFLQAPESSGPVQEGIDKFVAARQATSHPIVVSRWVEEDDGANSESEYGW